VTTMSRMLQGAKVFNQPLNLWDTSAVIDMSYLFSNASRFNQNINAWDTSSVTTMFRMFFSDLTYFPPYVSDSSLKMDYNQPMDNWNTSAVISTGMERMFQNCQFIDQDISGWCVFNIKSLPTGFDTGTPATWTTAEKPNWGAAC
jgi:surface protein